MSDYERNVRDPRLADPAVGDPELESARPTYSARYLRNSPGSWIGGIVVAILVLIALGYLFGGGIANNSTVEHRAAATDKAVGPPPPITAQPAPSPSEQAK